MIYGLNHRYVFIHIPRIAGVAITRALARVALHCAVDLTADRHMKAVTLEQRLSDLWPELRRWALARSPWDIVLRDYRLTLAFDPTSTPARFFADLQHQIVNFLRPPELKASGMAPQRVLTSAIASWIQGNLHDTVAMWATAFLTRRAGRSADRLPAVRTGKFDRPRDRSRCCRAFGFDLRSRGRCFGDGHDRLAIRALAFLACGGHRRADG